MRNVVLIIFALLGVSACGSRTQPPVPDTEAQKEIARLDSLVQDLQQKNAAQEERIKDIEDDLEGMMNFLNEQGY